MFCSKKYLVMLCISLILLFGTITVTNAGSIDTLKKNLGSNQVSEQNNDKILPEVPEVNNNVENIQNDSIENNISNVKNNIESIKQSFKEIKEGFKKVISGFKSLFKSIFESISSIFKKIVETIKNIFNDISDAIKGNNTDNNNNQDNNQGNNNQGNNNNQNNNQGNNNQGNNNNNQDNNQGNNNQGNNNNNQDNNQGNNNQNNANNVGNINDVNRNLNQGNVSERNNNQNSNNSNGQVDLTNAQSIINAIKSEFNITIEATTGQWDLRQLRETYLVLKKLPKSFIQHTQMIRRVAQADFSRNFTIAGYVYSNEPRVYITDAGARGDIPYVLVHEMAHCFHFARYDVYSKWQEQFWSQRNAYNGQLKPVSDSVSSYGNTNAMEDFAESVRVYVTSGSYMKKQFPDRYEFIKKYVMEGKEFLN